MVPPPHPLRLSESQTAGMLQWDSDGCCHSSGTFLCVCLCLVTLVSPPTRPESVLDEEDLLQQGMYVVISVVVANLLFNAAMG